MPNLASNTIALIGGAAVGAVAMYLLDPDQGPGRRKDISGAATDAVSSTRAAVNTTVAGASDSAHSIANTIGRFAKQLAHQASDRADDLTDQATDAVASARKAARSTVHDASDSVHGLADRIGKYATHLASRVKGHVSDARDSVSDAAGNVSDHVADAVDSAKSYGTGVVGQAKSTRDDWMDRASSLFARGQAAGRRAVGVPEPHPVATATGLTVGGLGVLALGVGLMYYLDPDRGHGRRALLRDKVYSVTRHSGDRVRRYGHHLGNKAQGYVAQAAQVVPEQWVEKVKSAVSRDSQQADETAPRTSAI
jgi:gas vesicle protein